MSSCGRSSAQLEAQCFRTGPIVFPRRITSRHTSGGKEAARLGRVVGELFPIQRHAEAWRIRDSEITFAVQDERFGSDVVDIGAAADELDKVGKGHRGGELQIGRETDRGVPAVANVFHTELIGEPSDAALFADAAYLGDIRLHNVERAAREPRQEGLAAGQYLASGDRHRARATQFAEI